MDNPTGKNPESRNPRARRWWLSLLSVLLIVGGGIFLAMGARDYLGSLWGQHEAEEEWNAPPPAPKSSGTPPSSSQPAVPAKPAIPAKPDLGTAFAKMSIPRLGITWFVYEGTDAKQLRLGPGHMRGTALPGTAGNCVIAGHRDTHFRILKDVRKGDDILIQTHQGKFRYTVTGTRIVKPTNISALRPTPDGEMKLITCYPFYYVGPAPKRFVVETQLRAAS